MLQLRIMLTKDDIQQLLEPINRKLDSQGKQLDSLTSEVSHIKTAMKSLATKEDMELQTEKVKSEIQADIRILNARLITKVQKHETSIKALHEGTGVPDPNTH